MLCEGDSYHARLMATSSEQSCQFELKKRLVQLGDLAKVIIPNLLRDNNTVHNFPLPSKYVRLNNNCPADPGVCCVSQIWYLTIISLFPRGAAR